MNIRRGAVDIPALVTCIFFGCTLPMAFAPWNYWVIAFISTFGLAACLRGQNSKSSFFRALLFGLGLFGVGASWVYISIHTHGNTAAPLAVVLTSLFVMLLATVFALPFALFGRFNSKSTLGMLLAFPAFWVLSELLRSAIFTGFPWLLLGNAMVDSPLKPLAPVIGVYGLSWVVAFFGALLASIPYANQKKSGFETGGLLAIAIVITSAVLAGRPWTTPAGDALSVGLVQPNLSLRQKWDIQTRDEIRKLYKQMNESVLGADLIVWPESAIPELRHHVAPYLAEVGQSVINQGGGLITGIPIQNPRTRKYYNSVIGLGAANGRYDKQHLVPFGEYVPLESLLRGTIGFFDLPMSSFSPGYKGQTPITLGGYEVATAICYEIAYPGLVREMAKNAQLIVTVSNDAWFGSSIGPHQHLQIAQMRALENGRPVIRGTNDGISALIDHRGKIIERLPQHTRATETGFVSPQSGMTPYARYGEIPVYIAAALGIFATLGRRDKTAASAQRSKPRN